MQGYELVTPYYKKNKSNPFVRASLNLNLAKKLFSRKLSEASREKLEHFARKIVSHHGLFEDSGPQRYANGFERKRPIYRFVRNEEENETLLLERCLLPEPNTSGLRLYSNDRSLIFSSRGFIDQKMITYYRDYSKNEVIDLMHAQTINKIWQNWIEHVKIEINPGAH